MELRYNNIYLIGCRCSGKTSTGKLLAEKLNQTFIDADYFVEKESGLTITEIVSHKGWEAFRKLEYEAIKRICSQQNQIVATGGGAVLDSKNVTIMKKTGIIIWLKATTETVKERIMSDATAEKTRPSLTGSGTLKEIDETIKKRDPYYGKAMDLFINTDEITIEDVCRIAITKLNQQQTTRNGGD